MWCDEGGCLLLWVTYYQYGLDCWNQCGGDIVLRVLSTDRKAMCCPSTAMGLTPNYDILSPSTTLGLHVSNRCLRPE